MFRRGKGNDRGARSDQTTAASGPTNVLRIIARLNVGGPAMQTATLAELLPADEFNQRVLTGDLAPGEASYLDVRSISIEVTRIRGLGRAVNPIDDLRALVSIGKVIREFKPTIVHTHTAKAGALGRIAAIALRVPIRVHTFHGHLLTGYFTGWKRSLVVFVERTLAKRTTALVSVGENVGTELLAERIGTPEQYQSIAPGVELGPVLSRAESRRNLGLDDSVPVVAFVGRLTAVKRPDRLLEVIAAVTTFVPNVTVLVVGDGDLRETTESRSIAQGLPIRFLGWRGDVADLLAAADVAVLTSDNEGMPVSLIEAAHVGIPSVTTRVGSVAEVVIDGSTGYIVDKDDVATFVARTVSLLDDPDLRGSMAVAARAHAEARLGRSRLANDYAELYRRLLAGQRRR